MKGYKGFKKGLVCLDKQYAENTVFEEDSAVICRKGMHFCENPFDVLDYYDLVNSDGSFNDFAEVEALADVKTDDNKKFCTTKLKVGAKIGSSGDFAQIGSSGDSAQIGSTGEDSVICCAGHNSAVKAKKGSWITLSEWERDIKKNRWVPVCVKTEFVDGERIKADTFYKLVKGEFTEQEGNNYGI